MQRRCTVRFMLAGSHEKKLEGYDTIIQRSLTGRESLHLVDFGEKVSERCQHQQWEKGENSENIDGQKCNAGQVGRNLS